VGKACVTEGGKSTCNRWQLKERGVCSQNEIHVPIDVGNGVPGTDVGVVASVRIKRVER